MVVSLELAAILFSRWRSSVLLVARLILSRGRCVLRGWLQEALRQAI